ncbi:MAG: histidine kinase [Fluviicola sp.]|nr:histidine kinase [Fluviicola sp.]
MHTTIQSKEINTTSVFRKSLLLLVLFVAALSSAHAQFDPPQPVFYNYSINEGLPSSETYFVHQDKKGYIWVCTDRGVARYNGYKMRVFTEKDGLPDNVVFKIYEDYKGRLWFLTYNGLLSYWDGTRIVPYKYNNLVKRYLGGDITTFKSLFVDRSGTIWYSAQYKGLVSISAKGTMKRIQLRPTNNLFLYRTNDNWLMCGLPVNNVNLPMGCSFIEKGIQKQIGHIERSPRLSVTDGNYFVHVGDEVIYLKNASKRRTVSNLIAVISLNEHLWYCTNNGVYKEAVQRFGKENLPASGFLKGYAVTSVCRDFEGGYWFSTLEKGVFYTPAIDLAVYQKKSDDNYNVITGITKWNGEVFYANKYGVHLLSQAIRKEFGTSYTSAARVDSKHDQLFNSVDQTLPRSAQLTDKHGNGKSGYFDIFFGKQSILFSHSDVIELRNDNSSKILYWYLDDHGDFPQHYFHAIMQDESKRVFAGNNNGLFEVKNQRLFIHQFKDPRFKKRVSDLDYHPSWKGIVATRGIGIYFFDNNKIIQQITTKEGLLDDQINSIFVDDEGVIWVCSNKGLNRISKDGNGKIVVSSLTVKNGLPSNEVNRVFVKNHEVWVATKNGLAHIPASYEWSQKRLNNQFSIDYLEAKGQFIRDFKELISFPAKIEYVKIGLQSSNFKTGKDKKIRYRYEHSDDWLYTTDGELILTKPASGDYELEISYMNEFGLWSAPKVMCRFSIDNPYYFKWYSVLLYIVLTALIVIFFFKRRIKQIQRKNQQQKNMQQLERKALQAQMNPHFIFNSLNSIQSFLLYEENEKAERFLLKFAQLIRQTLNNSRVSFITIETEIDTLRKYLELEQMRFKEKFTFTISVQLQPDQMLLGIPPMLIQPFVENAVLHGFKSMQSGGQISISFASLSSNRLICVIEDNGIGRNEAGKHQKESQHPSFGTKITAERLFAYQQKNRDEFKIEIIDLIENEQAAGTKVIMWIPVVPAEEFDAEES